MTRERIGKHARPRVPRHWVRNVVAVLAAGAALQAVQAQAVSGSLAAGFDPRISATPPSARAVVWAAAEDSQRRLIIGGNFDQVNQTARTNLARLLADGTLDPAFEPSPSPHGLTSVAIQPDGKILIGRQVQNDGGFSSSKGPDLLRLLEDGKVDPSFQAAWTKGQTWVDSILPQPDGSILIRRHTSDRGADFLRLGADGGMASSVVPGNPFALRQRDGSELRLEQTNNLARGVTLRRYRNGFLDQTFVLEADAFQPRASTLAAAVVQPDDRIVVASLTDGLPNASVVLRFEPDGRVDSSFPGVEARGGAVHNLVRLANGEILMLGGFSEVDGVRRDGIAKLLGTAGESPRLLTPLVTGSTVSVSWQTLHQQEYILEGTAQLAAPSWRRLFSVRGDGTLRTWSEPLALDSQKFYRLRIE